MAKFALVFISLCFLLCAANVVQSALFINIIWCALPRFRTYRLSRCRTKRNITIVVKPFLITPRNVGVIFRICNMALLAYADSLDNVLTVCFLFVHPRFTWLNSLVSRLFVDCRSSCFVCFLLLLLSGNVESNPGPGCSADVGLNGLIINARSIRNKVPQLHAVLHLHDIDFVAITETWLDSTIESS